MIKNNQSLPRLRGMSGRSYLVGSLLGKGSEGSVYEVVGDITSAIKIFNFTMASSFFESNICSQMENKIIAMVRNPVETHINGSLCFTWPEDVLYDENRFVGYIMPRVDIKTTINNVYRESSRKKIFPNNTWLYNVMVAHNLALATTSIHAKGHCIGDFNPYCILVDERSNITFIGTDSFEVTDKESGKVYKCLVGTSEMLAPELQGIRDLRDLRVRFTKESDCFSLAVMVFNLLMNGNHPFCYTNEPIEMAIEESHFYYGRTLPEGIRLPTTAPSYNIVPDYIRKLFDRAFIYTAQKNYTSAGKRPTADEWRQALLRMCNEPYTKCFRNTHHVYLSACCSTCPWCSLQQ